MKESFATIYFDLIGEKYQSFVTPQEKTNAVDQVWDMLQKAYAKVGGFKSATDKNDFINGTFLWKTIKKNGKVIAVITSKNTPYGRKPNGLATDGTPDGTYALIKLIRNEIFQHHSFFEVSGPMEAFVIRRCNLQNYKIPNVYAEQLTQKKIESFDPDGYHYERLIHGQLYKKMIIGNPKMTRDYDYEKYK